MRGHTLGAAIKLIVFAVVTILATAVLGVVISNRTFGNTRTYKAVFTDVTDLIPGNDVRLAGVRVGTVKSVDVVNRDQAAVTFTVDRDVPVTTSSKVEVHYLNLIGQRYLDLIDRAGQGTPQPTDQAIPVQRTAPAIDLTALFNGFRPLFQALTPSDVNSFSLEVIKTLQGEGGTVDSLLTRTASLTKTVANRDAVIGHVIDNLLTVLNTVEQRNAGLSETITQLQRLVTGLAGDRNTIAAAISKIDSAAASNTKFIAGIRPYLPKDLKSLKVLAHKLNTETSSNGKNTLADELETLPAKINRITRTATYGGYFNFWLCELDLAGLPFTIGPTSADAAPSCPAASS